MRIPRSEKLPLFTGAEALQLQLENGLDGPRPSPGHVRLPAYEKPEHKLETSPPGASIPIAPMQNEELADLLAEALQGHRAVLAELVSMRELHIAQVNTLIQGIVRVTNLVINLEWEEEEDALQEEV